MSTPVCLSVCLSVCPMMHLSDYITIRSLFKYTSIRISLSPSHTRTCPSGWWQFGQCVGCMSPGLVSSRRSNVLDLRRHQQENRSQRCTYVVTHFVRSQIHYIRIHQKSLAGKTQIFNMVEYISSVSSQCLDDIEIEVVGVL